MKLLVPFLVVAMLLPFVVQAGEYEVTPLLGYAVGGQFEDSDNETTLDIAADASFGLLLGVRDTSKEEAFYELLYSRQATHIKGDGTVFSGDPEFEVDINYLHLGGRYGKLGERVNPFIAAGLGVTHFKPERGDSETKFSFSIGGGVMVPLHESVSLRFEGRGFGTVFDSRGEVFCSNNQCAVTVDGDLLWQFSGFAGVAFTF